MDKIKKEKETTLSFLSTRRRRLVFILSLLILLFYALDQFLLWKTGLAFYPHISHLTRPLWDTPDIPAVYLPFRSDSPRIGGRKSRSEKREEGFYYSPWHDRSDREAAAGNQQDTAGEDKGEEDQLHQLSTTGDLSPSKELPPFPSSSSSQSFVFLPNAEMQLCAQIVTDADTVLHISRNWKAQMQMLALVNTVVPSTSFTSFSSGDKHKPKKDDAAQEERENDMSSSNNTKKNAAKKISRPKNINPKEDDHRHLDDDRTEISKFFKYHRRVFDIFLFNGEMDLLALRLEEMGPVVDVIIAVEGELTFRAVRKPVYIDLGGVTEQSSLEEILATPFWREMTKRGVHSHIIAPKFLHVVVTEEELVQLAKKEGMSLSDMQKGKAKGGKRFFIENKTRQKIAFAISHPHPEGEQVAGIQSVRPIDPIRLGDIRLESDLDEIARRGTIRLLQYCPLPPQLFPMTLQATWYQFSFEFELQEPWVRTQAFFHANNSPRSSEDSGEKSKPPRQHVRLVKKEKLLSHREANGRSFGVTRLSSSSSLPPIPQTQRRTMASAGSSSRSLSTHPNDVLQFQKILSDWENKYGDVQSVRFILRGALWHCSSCFRHMSDFVAKMTSYSHSEHDREHYKNPQRIQSYICDGKDLFDRWQERKTWSGVWESVVQPNSWFRRHRFEEGRKMDVPMLVKRQFDLVSTSGGASREDAIISGQTTTRNATRADTTQHPPTIQKSMLFFLPGYCKRD